MKHTIQNQQFETTLLALIRESHGLRQKDQMITGAKHFIKAFDRQCNTWGLRTTLAYFKEVRLAFTKYLSGEPLGPKQLNFTIGLTKDGLPKLLSSIIPLVREGVTPQELRLIMTLLTVGRSHSLPVQVPSYESITSPSSAEDEVFEDLEDDFADFVKRTVKRHLKRSIAYNFDKFYLTLSYGPNGPALRSSLWEATNLPSDFLKVLEECSPSLYERVDFLRANASNFPEWEQTFNLSRKDVFNFGRLSLLEDKEGKTRVIATLNYWSQCALKPIHDECMEVLKTLPWDCTHNQGNFKELQKVQCHDKWHSVDLKDATDRFPRRLQEVVVRALFGPKVLKLWSFIMTREFSKPGNVGNKVAYAAGQPMGAYSSFPVFALTHGLLLAYLAELLDITGDPFRILGDDVVIRNDVLAEKYKRVLTNLDVPISVTKTMQSVHTFEFAKRWFHKGDEISPFPVNAIHESLDSFAMLTETFRTAYEKGWHQNFCAGPGLVRRILRDHGKHPIFIKRFLFHYALFTSFPRKGADETENQRSWVNFLRLSGHYVSCVSWRDHVKQTYQETMRRSALSLLGDAIQSLAKQSDDLWRCLYYAGLAPSRSINIDFQKVLEWANPLLCVLRQQSEELDRLASQMDKINSAAGAEKSFDEFLRDYALLRVFSLEQLKKDRTHKMVVKARAKLMLKAHKLLVKISGDHFG